MKKLAFALAATIPVLVLLAYTNTSSPKISSKTGTPPIRSISVLAFGENGTLFIGDSKSATIFAVETKDAVQVQKASAVDIKNIDQKIAAFLGTEPKNITIRDLKVNPVSRKIYCAVQSSDGTPVLLRIDNEKIEAVSLKDVTYSEKVLEGAPAEDVKDKRGNPLRLASIADLDYADGKLLVSGISGQEFGSTFRRIPYPFTQETQQASLKIYHADHGRYETEAPIETFTTADLKGKKFLIASYTCTPLVLFPLDQLKPGPLVTGRTVGELGSWNRPLDMITMTKGNESFLILSNSDRPMMKIKFKDIESYQGELTTPVTEAYSTAGVPYISFPFSNVIQLDKLDDTQFVFIQRKSNGDLNLQTQTTKNL